MTESAADQIHPLRAWRKSQVPPLSLADLAAKLGTSKPNLSRIENGEQALSLKLARRATAALGIPMRELRPDLAEQFEPAPEPAA